MTGAASGIGRAFVERLVAQGWRCAACDADAEGLAGLAAVPWFRDSGSIALSCDVADAAEVEQMSTRVFEHGGPVDLVVHCAGVLGTGLSWQIPPAEWRRVIDINLFGTVHVAQAFLPDMVRRDAGNLVNIASMAALVSGAGVAPYSVSKHGVLALSECIARELAALGSTVRVHVVCPGAVRTSIVRRMERQGGAHTRELDASLAQLIDAGMPPDELARKTLEGVARGSFCILPHEGVAQTARRRFEALLDGGPLLFESESSNPRNRA